MLRCAASESPGLAWSARDISPATPASLSDPASTLHGGLHGCADGAGVTSAPLLVACQSEGPQRVIQVILAAESFSPPSSLLSNGGS